MAGSGKVHLRGRPGFESTAATACGLSVPSPRVTTEFTEVTCEKCREWVKKRSTSAQDVRATLQLLTITHAQLAEVIGVNPELVEGIETGTCMASAPQAERFLLWRSLVESLSEDARASVRALVQAGAVDRARKLVLSLGAK